ncbi:MAG: class I SAM-dependent methyltransferase [Alphaproteobacteria bacterium]|nr:class I SAM-dependent methyltransferase [Alphaproteobacteria bacterium]
MSIIDKMVIDHYESGETLTRILKALTAAGLDPDNLSAEDLAPFDEFHIGGRNATQYAVGKMGLKPDDRLLDVGCGIGGAARFVAASVGCHVTGIDLTPEFIDVARALSTRVGLSDRTDFEVASALNMPFEAASFDAAISFHAAMNIADRPALYAEIARVMKAGAVLCVYDVMKTSDQPLTFPLPWAESAATSHLITPEATVELLEKAGFSVTDSDDRSIIARAFFQQDQPESPPASRLPTDLAAQDKFKNILDCIETGRVAPVQIIATRNPA